MPVDNNSVAARARNVARTRGQDYCIGGVALHPVIARVIVVGAVSVVLSIGPVVLVRVGHHVVQSEPVVRGDEVDAGPRSSSARGVQVGRSGQSVGQLAQCRRSTPEITHRVSVAVVPLRELHTEAAHLIPPVSGIPRLGDELAPAEQRIGRNRGEHRRPRVESGSLGSSQRAGEVEAEAVDTHVLGPVTQRVQHQAHCHR